MLSRTVSARNAKDRQSTGSITPVDNNHHQLPPKQYSSRSTVVSVECMAGSSKADEWSEEMLQTGDIVEEIQTGASPAVKAPFKGGTTGVTKILREAFKRGENSVFVRVQRRAGEFLELHGCVVQKESGRRRRGYVVRSVHDVDYAVGFRDRTERDCLHLQGSRSFRVAHALSQAQLHDGFVSYPWEKKMKESLSIPSSSSLLSIVVFPKALDSGKSMYGPLEDTLARANAWLSSALTSGIPIAFINVQAEAVLTKISGDAATSSVNTSSISEIHNLANASLYGFEDYHGVDIGVMKVVRLWYTPQAGEIPIEIRIQEGDTKLGFAVGRTEEGFLYICSVAVDADNAPSSRSGLRDLFREATNASKRLVISRVSNEKILPWMISPSGAVRCFDTVSLSQKLSLHRHAMQTIQIHVFMWNRVAIPAPTSTGTDRCVQKVAGPEDQHLRSITLSNWAEEVGELSLRFSNEVNPDNWV